jgi:hypothetical protein
MDKIKNNKILRDEIMFAQTAQFFMSGFKKDEDSNTFNSEKIEKINNSLPRLCKKYTVIKFIYSR